MNARETGRRIGRRLSEAGIPDADFEAELLVRHASGLTRAQYFAGEEIPPGSKAAMCSLVKRRVRREPFAYIRGSREFLGLEFEVSPAVLIPRPETEVLVEFAAARAPQDALAVDVGTGSGCIAVSLASLRPDLRVVASDVSDAALAVARTNARRLAPRVEFARGSLAGHVGHSRGTPLVVLANLPYISSKEVDRLDPEVRDAEPRLALDGGEDGFALIGPLIRDCGGRLRPDLLLLEVALGQSAAVMNLVREAGGSAAVVPDLAGIDRVVVGQWA